MSEQSNVTTIDRMTKAVFEGDRETLGRVFTDDLAFHLRGPAPEAGDYTGVDGFLGVVGRWLELTNGDIELEQLFCIGTDQWAAEWEHAVLGRNGKRLESNNAFVYRLEHNRIAEMWMFLGADPAEGASFFA